MKIRGIDSASQEVRDVMGKCEICGAQATSVIQDLFEIIPFAGHFATQVETGEPHRFCPEHEREPKIVQLRQGPESIRP